MLALSVHGIPRAEGVSYEQNWDGFRCLLFGRQRRSRARQSQPRSLNRYFPELMTAARESLPDRCVCG